MFGGIGHQSTPNEQVLGAGSRGSKGDERVTFGVGERNFLSVQAMSGHLEFGRNGLVCLINGVGTARDSVGRDHHPENSHRVILVLGKGTEPLVDVIELGDQAMSIRRFILSL